MITVAKKRMDAISELKAVINADDDNGGTRKISGAISIL